ncbi:MAG: hypothetical protein EXR72_08520 [Myxococcales bacterium]|nr:hypothetical protein [Myxococcales bacterium]
MRRALDHGGAGAGAARRGGRGAVPHRRADRRDRRRGGRERTLHRRCAAADPPAARAPGLFRSARRGSGGLRIGDGGGRLHRRSAPPRDRHRTNDRLLLPVDARRRPRRSVPWVFGDLSAIVFGGYGTFGSLVARELACLGIAVRVAGRDRLRAETLAESLAGSGHRGIAADVTRPDEVRAALDGQRVAVSCAGPFARLGDALLLGCIAAGCHHVDLSDDRAWANRVRSLDGHFRARRLAAAWGCSSLPGLSGALALCALSGAVSTPERARVTLFIGNRNPKGVAAIRSIVGGLGKPIAAPQGILRGFGGREVVVLPPPFGRRAVYDLESPEYDLFPPLLGVRAVSVKVGFGLRSATLAFALLARLSSEFGDGAAALLGGAGDLVRGVGGSGGAVMSELFFPDGTVRRAAISTPDDGQRMVALPCAWTAARLLQPDPPVGALTAYQLLGARPLLDRLVAEGCTLSF